MNGHRPSGFAVRAGHWIPALLLILALAGAVLPARASTEVDVYLLGPGGQGGTTTITHTSTANQPVGTSGGADYHVSQSFKVPSGVISQFSVEFGATTGTPSGTATWEIDADTASGLPGAVLATGTFTPTASAVNVITVTGGPFAYAGTTYWLFIKSTDLQSANTYWLVRCNSADTYADGVFAQSSDTPSTYYAVSVNYDVWATFTTVLGQAETALLNSALGQSFYVGTPTVINGVKLDLMKFGSPTDTLTVGLYTSLANGPSGILVDAAATAAVGESTVTTGYTLNDFVFANSVTLEPGIKYVLELTTDRTSTTDYIAWGSSAFCQVDGSNAIAHTRGAWQPLLTTFLYEFDVVSVAAIATQEPNTNTYMTLPNGSAGRIDHSMTTGESNIASLLVYLLILLVFLMFIVMVKRR